MSFLSKIIPHRKSRQAPAEQTHQPSASALRGKAQPAADAPALSRLDEATAAREAAAYRGFELDPRD